MKTKLSSRSRLESMRGKHKLFSAGRYLESRYNDQETSIREKAELYFAIMLIAELYQSFLSN